MTSLLAATIGDPAAPAATLPTGEWQFWVVSAIALAAGLLILRPLLASRSAPTPCGGCSKHEAARPRATSLTIEGAAPRRR